MDAGCIWFLLDHALIFELSRLPLALHFESFRVQLMSGKGLRGRAAEILSRAGRQVGIGMHQDKKYVGIPAKLFAEQPDKVRAGVSVVQIQRTTQSDYPGVLPGFRWDLGGHGTFERRNALLAAALFRRSDSLVGRQAGRGAGCSRSFSLLSRKDRVEAQGANGQDKESCRA